MVSYLRLQHISSYSLFGTNVENDKETDLNLQEQSFIFINTRKLGFLCKKYIKESLS